MPLGCAGKDGGRTHREMEDGSRAEEGEGVRHEWKMGERKGWRQHAARQKDGWRER